MKLFLISQNVNNDYDTYSSAVVCAIDEDSARRMYPGGKNGEEAVFGEFYTDWARSINEVNVKYIGESTEEIPIGVVCASYHAG